jgi:hypothetical protein
MGMWRGLCGTRGTNQPARASVRFVRHLVKQPGPNALRLMWLLRVRDKKSPRADEGLLAGSGGYAFFLASALRWMPITL